MSSTGKPSGGSRLLDPARQRGLELIGDRWNMWLLVAIDENEGSRFSDLVGEPGLSRRVLTERLEGLVEEQLLRKEQYQARPPRYRYVLTERGVTLRRGCVAVIHLAAGGRLPAAAVRTRSVQPDLPTAVAATDAAAVPTEHPADRLLERDPAAARTIYERAVAPLVRYDDQYRTPLVDTLETYLDCDASVSVTAARLYAHRHTVRYRLGRVRELTGLDVDSLADREQLALGLRAYRILRRAGEELT